MTIKQICLLTAWKAASRLVALHHTLTTPTPLKASTAAHRAYESLYATWGRERWEK